MAKIEMTKEESILYTELKKLAKRANQRILRAERLTGLDKPFSVKELSDYLSVSQVNGWTTKTGRVRVSKSMTLEQMKMSIKATENFLKDEQSKVSGIKKTKADIEKIFDADITWEQANAYFQSFDSYTWIYEFMSQSDFWNDYGNPTKNVYMEKEQFVDELQQRIKKTDEVYKSALENLYYYCKYGG